MFMFYCTFLNKKIANLSAIITTGMLMLPVMTSGMAEASTTRRPAVPLTLNLLIINLKFVSKVIKYMLENKYGHLF